MVPRALPSGGGSKAGETAPPAAATSAASSSSSSSSSSFPPSENDDAFFALKLLVLVAVWWGASTWNAVSARRVLRAPDGSGCVAAVSAASNVLGVALVVVLPRLFPALQRANGKTLSEVDWGLSVAHAVGLYAAYRGLVGAKVSIVQTVKALEPLIAMAMSVYFLGAMPDIRSMLAAIVAVAGVVVVCVEDATWHTSAVLWVLASSLFTQWRNQLMKLQQRKREAGQAKAKHDGAASEEEQRRQELELKQRERLLDPFREEKIQTDAKEGRESWCENGGGKDISSSVSAAAAPSPALQGGLIFVSTSSGAFFVNAIMALAEMALLGGTNCGRDDPAMCKCKVGPVMAAGIAHFLYNLASFGVLAFVLPATHSLANTAKRAVVVGVSAVLLSDRLTARAVPGLGLVIVGAGYYSYVAKQKRSKSSTAGAVGKKMYGSVRMYAMLVAVLLGVALLSMVLMATGGKHRILLKAEQVHSRQLGLHHNASARNTLKTPTNVLMDNATAAEQTSK